jgi:hypothetical protein
MAHGHVMSESPHGAENRSTATSGIVEPPLEVKNVRLYRELHVGTAALQLAESPT